MFRSTFLGLFIIALFAPFAQAADGLSEQEKVDLLRKECRPAPYGLMRNKCVDGATGREISLKKLLCKAPLGWVRGKCVDGATGKELSLKELAQKEGDVSVPGCRFVGDYQRKIVKPTVKLRCGGRQRPAVTCEADIYCNAGSKVHQDYGEEYGLGNEPFTNSVFCLGDAEGNCPSMKNCLEAEGYEMYQDFGEVVKTLDEQSAGSKAASQ